jgi:hypothetical protein
MATNMTPQELNDFALTNALGYYLCDVPEDKTPDEILEMLAEEDDSILVWEPFEHHDKSVIADLVDDMARSLRYQYDYVLSR